MALRRYQKSEKPIGDRRTVFILIGKVIKITDTGILIKKANANNQFWIDRDEWDSADIKEDDLVRLNITISTYIGKDNTFKIKFRVYSVSRLEIDEVQSDHPAFMGVRNGRIEDWFDTNIEGLKIVKFKGASGETFYLRYFSDKDPIKRSCTIETDLRSTAVIIDKTGGTWEDTQMIKYTDSEGKEVEKEVRKWFPALQITSIKYS